jgi:hypothetical protein
VAEYLPGKHEVLSPNLNNAKKGEKKQTNQEVDHLGEGGGGSGGGGLVQTAFSLRAVGRS